MQPTAQAVGSQKKREQPRRGERNAARKRMTNDEKNAADLIQIKKREDVCPSKKLDLASVRARIDQATAHDAAEKTGPEYWRSLEELAGTEEFKAALHREFPNNASQWLL